MPDVISSYGISLGLFFFFFLVFLHIIDDHESSCLKCYLSVNSQKFYKYQLEVTEGFLIICVFPTQS